MQQLHCYTAFNNNFIRVNGFASNLCTGSVSDSSFIFFQDKD